MTWTFSSDVEEFVRNAGHLLADDPVAHTIALSVISQVRAGVNTDTVFAWWTDDLGTVTGAASQTPPYPVLVDVLPAEAYESLISGMVGARGEFTGVNGPLGIAVPLAAIAAERTASVASIMHATRLFRLTELTKPERWPDGSARAATVADEDLVTDWFIEFGEETHGWLGTDPRGQVRHRTEVGGLVLWCDKTGRPVSVAGSTLPSWGASRVGPVYTPPEFRRQGYAGAVTWAITDMLVKQELQVVLFTDLSNPTSNALYPRLGYQPVGDRVVFTFAPRG